MAINTNPIFIGAVHNEDKKIVNADSTNWVDIYTAHATYGSKVDLIIVTSTDTADRTLQLGNYNGSIVTIIGELLIPDGSGTNGVDPPLAFIQVMPWYIGSLHVAPGHKLQMKAKVAVTSGSYDLQVSCFGGDFVAS